MTDVQQAGPVAQEKRPISEHPCHGLFSGTGDRLTHRHWFQDNALMPTCERCGTPIDREHKEVGPVSWEPEKRRETVTLDHRYAISNAAMKALAEWLAWPDASRDGLPEVTVAQTLSFLRGLPNHLAAAKPALSQTLPAPGEVEAAVASASIALMYLQTGFIECPQCGEEVPTRDLDAAYELATVAQPAPSDAPNVPSSPTSATVAAANDEGVAELQVLRTAVKSLLPIGNDQLPGDRVIPIYVRMDELRALHVLATSRSQHEGASS